MGEIKVTDELLKEILPKVSDELVREWENSATNEHVFSPKFNLKMKNLIWKHKNRQLYKELWVVGKIAAIFVLVFGICFFGNKMVARANLDILFKKIEVALEDSAMYFYDEKTGMYCYTMYEPEYVPEGYVEVSRMVDDSNLFIGYKNAEGKTISWRQLIAKSGMVYGSDTEYDDFIEKQYNGDNVKIFIYKNGLKRLYYEIGSSAFSVVADDLSIEEIYEIINGMEEIEK